MPPPQMTTSAVSILGQAPDLEDDLERGQRADVPGVEWRRELHQVEADQGRLLGDRVQDLERLARRQAPRRRDLGAWRERRVERVDVERHVDLAVLYRRSELLESRVRIGEEVARADEG